MTRTDVQNTMQVTTSTVKVDGARRTTVFWLNTLYQIMHLISWRGHARKYGVGVTSHVRQKGRALEVTDTRPLRLIFWHTRQVNVDW